MLDSQSLTFACSCYPFELLKSHRAWIIDWINIFTSKGSMHISNCSITPLWTPIKDLRSLISMGWTWLHAENMSVTKILFTILNTGIHNPIPDYNYRKGKLRCQVTLPMCPHLFDLKRCFAFEIFDIKTMACLQIQQMSIRVISMHCLASMFLSAFFFPRYFFLRLRLKRTGKQLNFQMWAYDMILAFISIDTFRHQNLIVTWKKCN